MRFLIFTLLALCSFFLTAQDTIYVNDDASGANNGSSWQDAFTNLQIAIDSAGWNDEIWVAKGLYFPKTDKDGNSPSNPREKTFHLKEGIQVYGGFLGTEISRERDVKANPTVLSGDIGVWGDKMDNCYTVLTCVGLKNGYTQIDGFYIEKCYSTNARGSGISVSQSKVVFSNLIVRDNEGRWGAGLSVADSESYFLYCDFIFNKSNNVGGAVADDESKNIFKNCFFENNSAQSGGGYFGLSTGSLLADCTFKSNMANKRAGGFLISSIALNWPRATIKMRNVVCEANEAPEDGGAYIEINPGEFHNLQFFQNNSTGGGGVLTVVGNVNISNTLLHSNSGGLDVNRGWFGNEVKFSNLTITNNGDSSSYQYWTNDDHEITMVNSVINGRVMDSNRVTKYSNCLIPRSQPSGVWDPAFGVDNGGNIDSIPIFFSEENKDFRLWKCSPGFDAGDSTLMFVDKLDLDADGDTIELSSQDLSGFKRVIGSQVDIGAYEYDNLKFAYSDSLASYSLVTDSMATFSWINCITGQTVAIGDTFYHAGDTTNSYALVVSLGGCLDTSVCFKIDRNLSTSIVSEDVAKELEAYPNPFERVLNLSYDMDIFSIIEIYSISGNRVYFDNIATSKLDLHHLPEGLYVVRVVGENSNSSQTINVMKR